MGVTYVYVYRCAHTHTYIYIPTRNDCSPTLKKQNTNVIQLILTESIVIVTLL